MELLLGFRVTEELGVASYRLEEGRRRRCLWSEGLYGVRKQLVVGRSGLDGRRM